MENYVTLLFPTEETELANRIADVLVDKKVDSHIFDKDSTPLSDIVKDIKKSTCLIILSTTEEFDYRDYLKELKVANNKVQIVSIYGTKKTYQNHYKINELEYTEEKPVEILVNEICCIVVGGLNVKVNAFNRKKLKAEAIRLFNNGDYVWSLCLLLKVFKLHDPVVKEKIADAYTHLMNCDRAINYYSICLPTTDEDTQSIICNNLGFLYTQTRNLEFAEKYLKMACELHHPDALYNLGYLYETSWAYDSSKKRNKEAYDIYCEVLTLPYTSEASKAKAKEKLRVQADKLLAKRNYAAAMNYYKAMGDGAKVAECIRCIKMLRQAFEDRKRKLGQ